MTESHIISMLGRISLAIDEYDEEAIAACLAPDAVLTIVGLGGRERVTEGAAIPPALVAGSRAQEGRLRHVVTGATATITGSEASAFSYTQYVAVGEAALLGISESRDRFVLDGGSWKLAARRVVMLSRLK